MTEISDIIIIIDKNLKEIDKLHLDYIVASKNRSDLINTLFKEINNRIIGNIKSTTKYVVWCQLRKKMGTTNLDYALEKALELAKKFGGETVWIEKIVTSIERIEFKEEKQND